MFMYTANVTDLEKVYFRENLGLITLLRCKISSLSRYAQKSVNIFQKLGIISPPLSLNKASKLKDIHRVQWYQYVVKSNLNFLRMRGRYICINLACKIEDFFPILYPYKNIGKIPTLRSKFNYCMFTMQIQATFLISAC